MTDNFLLFVSNSAIFGTVVFYVVCPFYVTGFVSKIDLVELF